MRTSVPDGAVSFLDSHPDFNIGTNLRNGAGQDPNIAESWLNNPGNPTVEKDPAEVSASTVPDTSSVPGRADAGRVNPRDTQTADRWIEGNEVADA